MIPLEPMLASSPNEPVDLALTRLEESGRWVFEPKWDGHRTIAVWNETGYTRLFSRNGENVTDAFPEVHHALTALLMGLSSAVLDGELIVARNGRPDLRAVQDRAGLRGPSAELAGRSRPATFVAFDLLYEGGMDLRSMLYHARRGGLEAVTEDWPETGLLARRAVVTPSMSDGVALLRAVRELGMEGLVAKRTGSTYQSGRRSPDWVKLKLKRRVSAIAYAIEPGNGSRADTFGALRLALVTDGDPDTMIEIGKVGSGFTQRDLRTLMEAMRTRLTVVEVEFTDVVEMKLREPVFKGIRPDVRPAECVMSQLERP